MAFLPRHDDRSSAVADAVAAYLPKYYHRESSGQSAKRADHLFLGGKLLLQMKVACPVGAAARQE
jgi:hypothetical protein